MSLCRLRKLATVSHLNDQTKYNHIYYSLLIPAAVFANKQYIKFFKSLKFNFFIQIAKKTVFHSLL